ncbi:hypothetical protein KC340_g4 [Hortaea werneckii]|nr:hypothetical protein KC340_g4 [Hortaea werneckii]
MPDLIVLARVRITSPLRGFARASFGAVARSLDRLNSNVRLKSFWLLFVRKQSTKGAKVHCACGPMRTLSTSERLRCRTSEKAALNSTVMSSAGLHLCEAFKPKVA